MSSEAKSEKRVILVTGGTGLVGSGIQAVLKKDADVAKAHGDDEFIFLSSKSGDLRFVIPIILSDYAHNGWMVFLFNRPPG